MFIKLIDFQKNSYLVKISANLDFIYLSQED